MHQRARELIFGPKDPRVCEIFRWNMLAEFVRGASLEELPPFLASEDSVARGLANKRLQECLDSMSAGELPKFLTDTDPVVRNAASDLLLRGSK